jgi:hypothetical protein
MAAIDPMAVTYLETSTITSQVSIRKREQAFEKI